MIFDPLYLIVIGIGAAISIGASMLVKSTFSRYTQVSSRQGITGAQIAQRILQDSDIHDVTIEPISGSLTDHYDPISKTLRLSEDVYGSSSLAACGVAAHEVGHAIQHAQNYALLKFRSAWVPVASMGGNISIFIIFLAFMLGGIGSTLGGMVAIIGVGLFATTTVFTAITLPVEFDASKRALRCLEHGGYLSNEELGGAKKVLDAAALTYVAAFLSSLLTLLYWAYRLGLIGGRRN